MPFQHAIGGGQGNIIIPVFKSPDYVPGVSGWAIFRNGSAEFNNVTIRGGEIIGGTSLIYDGTPAKGSLFLTIADASGVDAFGNQVSGPGFTIGQWDPGTGAQLAHLGVDDFGNLYLANGSGLVTIYLNPTSELMGIYPFGLGGPGGLAASMAAGGGTDLFGNNFLAGVTVYDTAGTDYIQMVTGSPAELNVGTGDSAESTPGRMTAVVIGAGTTRRLQSTLAAAHVTGQAAGAGANFQAISPSADLTTSPAQAVMIAGDGTNLMQLIVSPTGVALTGPAKAGISADTWHTVTNPTGTTGTIRVKMLSEAKMAVIDVDLRLTTTSTSAATLTAGSLPSASYYPTAARTGYPLATDSAWSTTAALGSVRGNVPTSGALTISLPPFGGTGGTDITGTIIYPLD